MRAALSLFCVVSIVLFALPPNSLVAQPIATDEDIIIYSGTPSHTISCFPNSESDSPTTQNFDEYYLKNSGNECALVSDINLKIKSGLTFVRQGRNSPHKVPTNPDSAYRELMSCMQGSASRSNPLGRCYNKYQGTSASPECMEKLCKCNKEIVQQRISCGGTNKGFDCEAIKTALEKQGGAMLFVSFPPFGLGHAVQVEDIDCNLSGGMFSGGLYRDPNNPSETKIFIIDNKTSEVSIYSEGSIAGTRATGQYTVNPF